MVSTEGKKQVAELLKKFSSQVSVIASSPLIVIEEILSWTNNQLFLTQKICQLILESKVAISEGGEARRVEQIVRSRLIENWENQVAAEHLSQIRDSILGNKECANLLSLYQRVLQEGGVAVNGNPISKVLLGSGLVSNKQGRLVVANRIYGAVFDGNWVERELANATNAMEGKNASRFKSRQIVLKPWQLVLLILVTGVVVYLIPQVWATYLWNQGNNLLSEGEQLYIQGKKESADQKYQKALDLYKQLLSIKPNSYKGLVNKAYVQGKLGDFDGKFYSCQQASQYGSNSAKSWNCLGTSYQDKGNSYLEEGKADQAEEEYKKAITKFDEALKKESNFHEALANRGETHLKMRELWLAFADLEKAIEIKENEIYWKTKGDILFQLMLYKQAIAAYNLSLKIEPKYLLAQTGSQKAQEKLNDIREALSDIEKEIKANPKSPEVWYKKGLLLCNMEEYAEAGFAFSQAIKLNKNYQDAISAQIWAAQQLQKTNSDSP